MPKEHLQKEFDKLAKIDKNSKRVRIREQEIRYFDRRYDGLTSYILLQLRKRNVDINDEKFDAKLDDIINSILASKLFKDRFFLDKEEDIKNAVKRKINAELNQEKQGHLRDE